MTPTIRNTLKWIFKSLGIFILGGISGVVILLAFFLKETLERVAKDADLGIIALAPILTIMYSITYFLAGGFIGLSAYLIYKSWKHKKT